MTEHRVAVSELAIPDREELTARFQLYFSRPPSASDLLRLRRSEAALHLRLPARTRRRLASFIATA